MIVFSRFFFAAKAALASASFFNRSFCLAFLSRFFAAWRAFFSSSSAFFAFSSSFSFYLLSSSVIPFYWPFLVSVALKLASNSKFYYILHASELWFLVVEGRVFSYDVKLFLFDVIFTRSSWILFIRFGSVKICLSSRLSRLSLLKWVFADYFPHYWIALWRLEVLEVSEFWCSGVVWLRGEVWAYSNR